MSEKLKFLIPLFFILITSCFSGQIALAEDVKTAPASAEPFPGSSSLQPPVEVPPLSDSLEGHQPSRRSGPPLNPVGDPRYAKQPLVWMDFVSYIVEMGMLGFALVFFATAIIFAVKKKWAGLIALLFLSMFVGVLGLAVPGLCLMAVKYSLTTPAQQWSLVNGVMVSYAIGILIAVAVPIVVSQRKLFSQKRKLFIAGMSIGSSLFPIFWVVAIALAIADEDESASSAEPNSENLT